MKDMLPEGYVAVRTAVDQFLGLWLGPPPATLSMDELSPRYARQAELMAAVVHAFARGDLTAEVRTPGDVTRYALPLEAWHDANASDVFFSDEVRRPVPGAAWEPYVGRTLMVLRDRFAIFLRHNQPPPQPEDFDPFGEAYWTLEMVGAWVATRDRIRVVWQWDEYRKRRNLPPARWATSAHLDDGEPEDETQFRAGPALKEIARQCINEELVASAEPANLTVQDWMQGRMEYDNSLTGRWVVPGRGTFTNIRFRVIDAMRVWPRLGEDKRSGPAETTINIAETRRLRRPSPQQIAILDYLKSECAGMRPPRSDEQIAEDVVNWVTQDPRRQKKYRVGEMNRSTVYRFFTKSAAWREHLQQVAQ